MAKSLNKGFFLVLSLVVVNTAQAGIAVVSTLPVREQLKENSAIPLHSKDGREIVYLSVDKAHIDDVMLGRGEEFFGLMTGDGAYHEDYAKVLYSPVPIVECRISLGKGSTIVSCGDGEPRELEANTPASELKDALNALQKKARQAREAEGSI